MIRRRPTPWIHRWSRLLISAIALIGAIGTAYLTYVKFSGGSAACPSTGCERVLSSDYATVFGLPLTLFGFLGYFGMGAMAISPYFFAKQKDFQKQLEGWTWPLLFLGATAMAVFSAYLMYILSTELKLVCIYCIVSALFTWSMLVLTVIGRDWDDIGQLVFQGFIVGLFVLVGTLGVYANISSTPEVPPGEVQLEPIGQPVPPKGWLTTTVSGEAEFALADHLRTIGAKEYKAWWCPHCHEQKQLFGKQAYERVPHIECADGGENAQPAACEAADIKSFPTWDIAGKRYTGVLSMEKLADYSNYQGPRNFKYNFEELKGFQPKQAPTPEQ